MRYFVSDFHFSHINEEKSRGIIHWERTQFETIQDHDKFLACKLAEWSAKYKPQDEFWVLGDWGNTDWLYLMDMFQCKTVFVYGNHDAVADLEKFELHFDEVHIYPIYLSNKLVVSHIPQAVYSDQLNVHGHLHGMKIDDPRYISCSINDINYNPVSDKIINSALGKLPKYQRRFLWEPYADQLVVTNDIKREDLVCSPRGQIDVSASRLLQQQKRKDRKDAESRSN